jgi:hypothetical protein
MVLAQDRDRWRALVSTVKKLGFHKMRGISWLAAKTGQLLKKDCAVWGKYVRKGKAVPLQAWTGLEGSGRLRLPDLMTIGT